jgi:hypothetical protein
MKIVGKICKNVTYMSPLRFADGRRALKAVKALCGLISRPILDLGNFFKSQCHHKIQENSCKEIQI